jgi:LCP family protein required for cell wall assembly
LDKLKPAQLVHSIVLVCLALSALACAIPGVMLSAPAAPYSQQPPLLVVAPPGSTATPTPFQPLPPTPTYLPTNFPTPTPLPTPTPGVSQPVMKSWADYPGPSVWPDIDIPAPAGLLAQPVGQVNILLLGSDLRPNDYGFRTDTILLLTLNPNQGKVSLTSFPRDLYVYIPGYTVQRINTAFGFGDFAALTQTFEYNFGVRPDRYVLINFWSFKDVIDNLGGIEVEVAVPFSDQRDGYKEHYYVPAGTVPMDGETALWYVRARYTTNDFDRGRRQAEVLQAMFKKLLTLDAVARAPQLYEIYRQNVITNLTFEDIAPLLPLAAQVGSDTSHLHRFAIGPGQVYDWMNVSGSQVLVPVREAVLNVMRQALSSP